MAMLPSARIIQVISQDLMLCLMLVVLEGCGLNTRAIRVGSCSENIPPNRLKGSTSAHGPPARSQYTTKSPSTYLLPDHAWYFDPVPALDDVGV